MKNIASVIVDVPSLQTNKTFDYKIPGELVEYAKKGMRVIVPFGRRNVQGFIVDLKDHSPIKELKEIIELMDLEPVLTEELLELGDYLAETTLCLKITAFQAMLPPALKAKYEKYLVLRGSMADVPEPLKEMFAKINKVNWKEAEKNVPLPCLYKKVRNGLFDVMYEVKSKGRKKKNIYYLPAAEKEQFIKNIEQQKRLGEKQKKILNIFINHFQPFSVKQMEQHVPGARAVLNNLVKRGLLKKEEHEVYRDPYAGYNFKQTKPLKLTVEQEKAIVPILDSIAQNEHRVFLLHGVTGSGKTEIYLQAIEKVINKGKEAIVLVPEISLTPQMVERFKGRFGNNVAVLHSALSTGEKYDEWRKVQRGEVQVVVGARSAIFAPFENIGMIIIDEEHETTYKQEDYPKYHARDVALKRGKKHNCPVVLGSATPSLESAARAQKNVYQLLPLTERINKAALPKVRIVDMRDELKSGNRSMFSKVLLEAIKDRLEKSEQIVLMLNRRGYSSFVMCRDCGFVVQCPYCDISLTYHKVTDQVKCHYCGFEAVTPRVCPECNSKHIRFFGTGTQRVEEELGKILPKARVIRMDVDTTGRKGAHEKLLRDFGEHKADILLGTQMIAKGLDFPKITLVGVLSADSSLHIPDFRSSERTFQLLTQVSGRAGRHELPGEVIIQTYTPEHYSIQFAKNHNYDAFYRYEMMVRKKGQYPPFYYLALVHVNHENMNYAYSVIEKITTFLRAKLSNQAIVLGPAASPIMKIKNRYRYQCLVKYKHEPDLIPALKKILQHFREDQVKRGLTVSIDLNPFSMM